ncbi:MAG: DNA-directed RNA polymerase subunit beta [candidate division Zixibacteria bacterium]|nr:DNA-directed RNA polymerase subunit beta [candidate division Zixibacteria bacterium]
MARKLPIQRKNFGKIPSGTDLPNLLDVQLKSYNDFLQADIEPDKRARQGLQQIFHEIFPISDIRENHTLEFIGFRLGTRRYSIKECQERNMSYAAPLKATLRLVSREGEGSEKQVKDIIEQEVYLGELPQITTRGTFVINGSERVIVSQLHRSPGVFFDSSIHPNGKILFSARIIPYRGSWVEFTTDINNIMFVHIDSRRKLHATTLLRAIGFSSNEEILELFYDISEVVLTGKKAETVVGNYAGESVVDTETGEIIFNAGETVTESHLTRLIEIKQKKLKIIEIDEHHEAYVIINTLAKDVTTNREEALAKIYTLMRPGEPPTIEMAQALLDKLFFNDKRYDLGEVGRYMINQRLKLDIPLDHTTLDIKDFLSITKYLVNLRNGHGFIDDIDHLGNRRARTVGELLSNLYSVGLSRVARNIRERMSLKDADPLTPQALVNARTVSSVVETFFGSSQLSQFMDQTNPLMELTHKRRLSALGPGGLTRERAGFEVRDVHHTHYGRLCPVETPEGPNIGLIVSLATYARINRYGFIETPYREFKNGKFTGTIKYLAADEEDRHIIAQSNEELTKTGKFVNDMISARHRDDYPVVAAKDVEYMDVSPKQLVSVAASLIPFLEHDDANRALMGSNMQRQAVPLLKTDAPYVGTGMEKIVATDAGVTVIAKRSGKVVFVDAQKVIIRPNMKTRPDELGFFEDDIYELTKFTRSNQDTCINHRPIIEIGDEVEEGDLIADGPSTDRGELALGRNVLVAFMPWLGYNFEDAIILSEQLIKDDIFTSIHIEEFELQVRDTKRGAEEITREIPNVSEEALLNLDENGIIRIGAEVESGDILVGKVTPKGETELSPEERLLRAIFGEKAGDVRDASMKAPPGMRGIIIDTKVFSRKERTEEAKKYEKSHVANIKRDYNKLFLDIAAYRNKRLGEILNGKTAGTVRSIIDNSVLIRAGHKFKNENLLEFDFDMVVAPDGFTDEKTVNRRVEKIIGEASKLLSDKRAEMEVEIDKVERGTELPPGVKQLVKVQVAIKRKISVGDKMAGRHGNKGVVSRIVPVEDMPYMEDGTPVDIILNPLGVPSRMNVGQLLETHLGAAGARLNTHYATPVFDGASLAEIKEELKKAGIAEDGKTTLYDGRTGEQFDNRVTVGQIYMLKLSHLVDDKIHARSIGPYSLVTQQPLGGKAQFGGQRFGEMEVWALEAYGAAYTLQEMLTVKSDDVAGRSKIYESIVKGENPPEPGIPESFNVLIKELQALGLDVTLMENN